MLVDQIDERTNAIVGNTFRESYYKAALLNIGLAYLFEEVGIAKMRNSDAEQDIQIDQHYIGIGMILKQRYYHKDNSIKAFLKIGKCR